MSESTGTALATQLAREVDVVRLEDVRAATDRVWSEHATALVADGALASLLTVGKAMIWDVAYDEPDEGAGAQAWTSYQDKLLKTLESVLCLYESASDGDAPVVADAGAQVLPLIEDTIDLTSCRSWHVLFTLIETRRKRLVKGMQPNKGKALVLLRTLNTLLRLLPRIDSTAASVPSDLELRARIHLLLADVYGITDQSGTNQRGDYAPLGRAWAAALRANAVREGENVDMEQPEEKQADKEATDDTIFQAIAGLQRYFAQPGLLAAKPDSEAAGTSMADFRNKSDLVLSRMFEETQKGSAAAPELDFATDVVSADLIEFQLADSTYRRRLLTQFLIFLQTLQQLNPEDKKHPRIPQFPPTFTVAAEDLQWARSTFVAIRDEFSRMDENGDTFDRLLGRVVGNDRHHAIWKSLGAYAFEEKPMDAAWLDQAEKQAQVNLLNPAKPYQWSAGTRALTEMAMDPLKSVSQLRNAEMDVTLDQLKQEYDEQEQQEAEEAQSKMQVDENDPSTASLPPQVENKASLSWRALRLVISDHLPVFEQVPKGDLPRLYAVMHGLDQPTTPATGGPGPGAANGQVASNGDVKAAEGSKPDSISEAAAIRVNAAVATRAVDPDAMQVDEDEKPSAAIVLD